MCGCGLGGGALTQKPSPCFRTRPGNETRLARGKDAVPDGNYPEDVDNQGDDNYGYDAIGNLTKDSQAGISSIGWNVYGKITSITKGGSTITYRYDPSGHRIGKLAEGRHTWYVRDAQGNVMAVYEKGSDGALRLREHHLYGSSRLGVVQRDLNVDVARVSAVNVDLLGPTYLYSFERGKKLFELGNHLGNVLATVSDRTKSADLNDDGIVDYFEADVVSANDYYPFGMLQPGRKFSTSAYRYGFNGKENDGEIKGDGNQYDYGFRIYDPRIGRFLSVDPLTKEYPELTPYQFASNTPIEAIDLDGLESSSSKKEGFWKSFGKSVLRGIDNTITYVMNNPNHAGYGGGTLPSTGKPPTQADFKRYEINWSQQLNPTWQIQNFSHNLVYGTTNFVGGIVDGDGARTAQAIPQLASAVGTISIFKGGISLSSVTKGGSISKIDIALGKNINLYPFAKRTSSSSFHTWDNIPGYSAVKNTFTNFEDAFNYATDAAINTNGKIKFNLEYVNLQQVGQIKPGTGLYQPLKEFGNKSLWEMNMTTEWELSQVLNNPQLSKITEFQRMGVSVPESTVRELAKPKK